MLGLGFRVFGGVGSEGLGFRFRVVGVLGQQG